MILKTIEHSKQPYTPDKALAIIIDRKITVETYKFLRLDLQERGFPPYYKVQEARSSCYPSGMTISEREASVTFQNLLQHTFDKILILNDEVITQYCEQVNVKELECTLQGNWGFDGSTGQVLYKQPFLMLKVVKKIVSWLLHLFHWCWKLLITAVFGRIQPHNHIDFVGHYACNIEKKRKSWHCQKN